MFRPLCLQTSPTGCLNQCFTSGATVAESFISYSMRRTPFWRQERGKEILFPRGSTSPVERHFCFPLFFPLSLSLSVFSSSIIFSRAHRSWRNCPRSSLPLSLLPVGYIHFMCYISCHQRHQQRKKNSDNHNNNNNCQGRNLTKRRNTRGIRDGGAPKSRKERKKKNITTPTAQTHKSVEKGKKKKKKKAAIKWFTQR